MGALQGCLNGSRHLPSWDWSQGGPGLNHHVGGGRFAGLRAGFDQVNVVPQPDGFPFRARVCLWIRAKSERVTPSPSSLHGPARHVALPPDTSSSCFQTRRSLCARSRKGFSLRRRIGACQRCQQMKPIASDVLSQSCTLAFACGHAVVLHAVTGAIEPVGAHLLHQPVRDQTCQIIQDSPQRLAHAIQIRERTHPCRSPCGESVRCFPPSLSQPCC